MIVAAWDITQGKTLMRWRGNWATIRVGSVEEFDKKGEREKMMSEKLFLENRLAQESKHIKRWSIVAIGLLLQLGFLLLLVVTSQQPVIILQPVAGQQDVCRVVSIGPLTEGWLKGVQPGAIVRPLMPPFPFPSPSLQHCQLVSSQAVLEVVAAGPHTIFSIHTPPALPTTPDLILTSMLAITFALAGILIFVRAQDRPTARVAYGLFYVVSFMSSLFAIPNHTLTWLGAPIFIILTGGLSTTFVCLFPHPYNYQANSPRRSWLPYLPLDVGVILALLNLPVIFLAPQSIFMILLLTLVYNIACLFVVIWVLIWGLGRLNKHEQPLARMIMLGVIFLLIASGLSLGIISPGQFLHSSTIHLAPIPLVILPIVCDYALFRNQLVGTTRLLSRKVVRIFLWALLASLFVFPIVILLHWTDNWNTGTQSELRDYIYAGLLVSSLWLFPLVWNKVREVGDHVFYHDFYQYNRTLQQLSTALTSLRGVNQISNFLLPQLAQILNATEVALLIRATSQDEIRYNTEPGTTRAWHQYRYTIADAHLSSEYLRQSADLALVHFQQRSHEPVLIGDLLLLALYDGDQISGFLCLGTKKNQEPYDRQDKSFLTTLAAQISVLEVNNRYLEQAEADAHKLTALNHRVIAAQETERRHLALDLHDDVLQEAMLLVRQLSDASAMSDVADAMPLARSVVTNLRRTCLALRPSLLEDLGLAEALRWLGQQTEHMSNGKLHVLAYSINRGTELRAADTIELAFYRVAQEALSNVLKHAQASKAVVLLRSSSQGRISLVIADNGCGFRMGDPHLESLGIIGMYERMGAIGGQIQIRTRPGHGTVIRATYTLTHPHTIVPVHEKGSISTSLAPIIRSAPSA